MAGPVIGQCNLSKRQRLIPAATARILWVRNMFIVFLAANRGWGTLPRDTLPSGLEHRALCLASLYNAVSVRNSDVSVDNKPHACHHTPFCAYQTSQSCMAPALPPASRGPGNNDAPV